VDQVVRAVRLHLDFFQDDALFLVDVLVAEERMEHQVGDHIEGQRQVLVEHLGVEADQFLGGEGVQVAAHRIDGAGDIFGGAVGGALEQHMLDEVRDAVLLGIFAAGAGADPDAHGDGAHVRHGLGDHAHAIRQRGHFDVAHGGGVGGHGGWGGAVVAPLYLGYNLGDGLSVWLQPHGETACPPKMAGI
jgi:hypothetical protein